MTTPAAKTPGWNPDNYDYAPVTVAVSTSGAVQMATGIGLILAITVANESVTTPARFTLQDGADTTSPVIAALAAPGGDSCQVSPASPGIYFGTGLYLGWQAGSAHVTVTYIPLLTPLK